MMMSERAEPPPPPDDRVDDTFLSGSPTDHAAILAMQTENTVLREKIAGLEAENAARESVDAPEWVSMKEGEWRTGVGYSTLQKWAVKKGWVEWRRQKDSKLVELNMTSLKALLKRRGRPVLSD